MPHTQAGFARDFSRTPLIPPATQASQIFASVTLGFFLVSVIPHFKFLESHIAGSQHFGLAYRSEIIELLSEVVCFTLRA